MLNKIALLRQWAERAANATVNYARTTYVAMWALILTCTIYGCMLIHSARPIAIKTQVMAATIGFIGAFFISLMDYHRLGQLWPLVGGGCIFLVGLTFVVGQSAIGGNAVADDVAWLNIFGYSFQPSELMKIGFIVTFSYHLSRVVEQGTLNTLSSVFLLGGHAFVPVILCNRQGDDGTALMFLVIFLIMFFSSGLNWKFIGLGLGAITAMAPIFWQMMSNHQRERFSAVYNPKEGDEKGILYQQTLGKIAIGNGGLLGEGHGTSTMIQSGLVPEDHNDFIFTVACEEFGFIGALFLLGLLFAVMLLSLYAAFKATDMMGRFMCIGFFAMIATQTMFNIGMCVSVLPVIGITLPFFSAGGSSSMCLYFGVGLVQSVYMRTKETTRTISQERRRLIRVGAVTH
ncbi:MAG: FtsW/RodA/SpoVE family cell cycle protein [Clostridia bacterium]|jgi:rod shape determining protein RodA|nr:FtsW/RodA/SpoVE family cell cycle protein [Clostridia bacterium]